MGLNQERLNEGLIERNTHTHTQGDSCSSPSGVIFNLLYVTLFYLFYPPCCFSII